MAEERTGNGTNVHVDGIPTTNGNGTESIAERIAIIGGAFTAAIGAAALVGWMLDIGALKSILPNFASMKANTALCFILLGGAIALSARRMPPGWRAVARAAASAVAVIGGLTLLEYVAATDLGIDELLFRDDPTAMHTYVPGRMCDISALLFLSLGAVVACADRLSARGRRIAMYVVLAGFIGAYRVLVGYALHDEGSMKWFGHTSMALHTSVAFIVAVMSILLLPAFREFSRHLVSPASSGRFLRRAMPVALLAPIVVHLLLEPLEEMGLSQEAAESYDALLMGVIFSFILIRYSGLLHRTSVLEQTLRKLQYGVDHANEAVFMTDTEGLITYVNPAFERLYGWAAAEVIGKTTPRILKSGMMDRTAYEYFWKTLAGGQVVVGELVNRTKDGRMLSISGSANPIVDGRGTIIGYMGIQHDITKRKETEKILADREARLNDAQRIAKMGSWTFDPGKRAVTWSPGMRRLLGIDPEAPVPSYEERRRFYTPESWERLERSIKIGLSDGKDAEFDLSMFRQDGTPFDAHLRGAAVRDAGGGIVGFHGTLQDVTEEHRTRARISELDVMKNKFVQIVSHQLRTPLTSVRWALEEILDRKVGRIAKAQEPHLKMAMEANTDVILTISNLIEAMDIEEGRMRVEREEACFEDVMRSACATFEHRFIQRAITHRHDLPETQRTCGRFDPRLVREAVMRLLDNAIAYSNDGGTVVSRVMQRGDRLRFEVEDGGIGIPKAEQARVWDRFYRASNAAVRKPDGCGLGLFISKSIIEAHGGTIGFASEERKGSTFWFEIPMRS